jgi:hypothetical protein
MSAFEGFSNLLARTAAVLVVAAVALADPCQAKTEALSDAWFYSTTSLRVPAPTPITWCSFVTGASAKAAARNDRFDSVESGWLRYSGNYIERLMVISQSEDSYVEDSYTLGRDLAVKEVVRKGHYVSDPFVTAIFRPDASGHLRMTARSRKALRKWNHFTYFLEWPLYAKFSEIPFAGLIRLKRPIAVKEACQQTRN